LIDHGGILFSDPISDTRISDNTLGIINTSILQNLIRDFRGDLDKQSKEEYRNVGIEGDDTRFRGRFQKRKDRAEKALPLRFVCCGEEE
jgi:hypothetical protein